MESLFTFPPFLLFTGTLSFNFVCVTLSLICSRYSSWLSSSGDDEQGYPVWLLTAVGRTGGVIWSRQVLDPFSFRSITRPSPSAGVSRRSINHNSRGRLESRNG